LLSSAGMEHVASQPNHRTCRLLCAGATDRGRKRTHNEDRFGLFPELGLFLVTDGMGGAAAGEVAAQKTVELVCQAFVDTEITWPVGVQEPTGDGLAFLVAAIVRANHRLHGMAQSDRKLHGMGTTIAALLAGGESAVIAHVGDSRVYRFREGDLSLLTEDHSLFNDFVRVGLADPDRPEEFAHPNTLSRAVGTEQKVQVDARRIDVQPGDTFLLCSDGLSVVVDARSIADVLHTIPNLDEAAANLVTLANEAGGPDNITAVLVRNEVTTTGAVWMRP
jgi:serine/threonine protein phosphatase PrpC